MIIYLFCHLIFLFTPINKNSNRSKKFLTFQAFYANDLELGGRYAKVTKTTVTGSGHITYPQLPEGNPFRCDPVPPESPLGYRIDDLEPVGEPHEIANSIRKSSTSGGVDGGDRPTTVVPLAGSGPVAFRRRI